LLWKEVAIGILLDGLTVLDRSFLSWMAYSLLVSELFPAREAFVDSLSSENISQKGSKLMAKLCDN
jgi:hypothetical protein